MLSLLLNLPLESSTWNTAPFNGLVFDVTAGGPLSFAAYSIDPATTMTGFTAPRVGLGANQLTIDWNGLTYVDGTKVVVDFTAAPIPEPETYAMLALGLGMFGAVGAALRRRAA